MAETAIPLPREQYVYMAKLAQQADRYEDMMHHMNNLVSSHVSFLIPLTMEENDLFSKANKNVIEPLRSGRRTLLSLEQNNDDKKSTRNIRGYRRKMEAEISGICGKMLRLVDDILLPSVSYNEPEKKVYYLIMKGDYCRYWAECTVGRSFEKLARISNNAYRRAMGIAFSKLNPAHPLALSVALNLSVFYYDISNEPEKACTTARRGYCSALSKEDLLNSLPENYYKCSVLLMQRLKDNLTHWEVQNTMED